MAETKTEPGHISIENIPPEFGLHLGPLGPHMEGHFQVTTADDGRVWININGICFLRFKPGIKDKRIAPRRCKDFYIKPETGICEVLGRVAREGDCRRCTCPMKEERLEEAAT